MAIRILHQPSGAAVGAAAFAAGQGKARQRQQKYALDIARDERRYSGSKYRLAAAGGAARQRLGQQGVAQQPAGTMVDQLDDPNLTPEQRRTIQSQRRRNAAARRAGGGDRFPDAEPQFKAARTKDQIRRAQELKDDERNRQFAMDDAKQKRDDERRINERELGEDQDKIDAAMQVARDAELENDRQAGKLTYSARAQTEIDKLDADLIEVRKDKGLDAAQKAEATEQINEQRREINRWGLETPEDPNKFGFNLEDGRLVPAEPGGRPADFTYVPGQDTAPQPTPFYQAQQEAETKQATDAAAATAVADKAHATAAKAIAEERITDPDSDTGEKMFKNALLSGEPDYARGDRIARERRAALGVAIGGTSGAPAVGAAPAGPAAPGGGTAAESSLDFDSDTGEPTGDAFDALGKPADPNKHLPMADLGPTTAGTAINSLPRAGVESIGTDVSGRQFPDATAPGISIDAPKAAKKSGRAKPRPEDVERHTKAAEGSGPKAEASARWLLQWRLR